MNSFKIVKFIVWLPFKIFLWISLFSITPLVIPYIILIGDSWEDIKDMISIVYKFLFSKDFWMEWLD
jgi:hypothetical protein